MRDSPGFAPGSLGHVSSDGEPTDLRSFVSRMKALNMPDSVFCDCTASDVLPEYYEEVERPARVAVRFQDIDGAVREVEADGLFATCVQHEIDHLNGVLFIDHISKLKRDRVMKKFTKAARREAEG